LKKTIIKSGGLKIPRALIVDDEPDILELASIYLSKLSNFEVLTARSATEALEILNETEVDVVVSDYQMPGMDGIQLLKEIKSRWKDLPFILFTGKGRNPKVAFTELVNLMVKAISKRKAEEVIEHNARRFKSLIEHSYDLIMTVDRNMNVNYVSPSIWKLLGYGPADISDLHLQTLIHPDDFPRFSSLVKKMISGCERSVKTEVRIRHKNGEWRIFEVELIFDRYCPYGEGIILNSKDITDRKMIELEVRRSREEMELILDALNELVAYQDLSHRVVWLNKAAADSVGKSRNELIGKFCYEIWHNRTSPCEDCPIMKAVETGESCTGDINTPDGRWWRVRGTPVRDETGNIIGAIEVTLEITEQKKAVQVLKGSENLYRMLVEDSSLGMYIFQDGKFVFVNDAFARMSGYSKEEILSMDYLDFVHPDFREEMRKYTELAMRGEVEGLPEAYDFMCLSKTGEIRWCRLIPHLIEYAGRRAILGVLQDITNYKKIEEAFLESETFYRTLFENTGTATIVVEDDMTVSMVNTEFEKITGYSKEEIEGRMNLLQFVAPEDREMVEKDHRLRRKDPSKTPRQYRIRLLRKGGDIRVCRVVVSLIPGTRMSIGSFTDLTQQEEIVKKLEKTADELEMLFDNINTMVWYATDPETYGMANRRRAEFLGLRKEELRDRNIREFLPEEVCEICIEGNRRAFAGERVVQEEWITGPDGNPHCLLVSKIPHFDKEGNVDYVFCTATDITHLKKIETALDFAIRKLNLWLKLTRHDILNQLAIIQGYLDLMDDSSDMRSPVQYLEKIKKAVERVEEHLRFTKELEEVGRDEPVWIRLSEPVERAVSQFEFHGIEVRIDERVNDIMIFSDSMIWKVFYNLMNNTLKHANTATRISISAQIVEDGLDIIYEDDGVGIPKEKGEDIFALDYGGRIGRGLLLVKDILSINEMGIEETGEKGVRFVIHVPRHRFKLIKDCKR